MNDLLYVASVFGSLVDSEFVEELHSMMNP